MILFQFQIEILFYVLSDPCLLAKCFAETAKNPLLFIVLDHNRQCQTAYACSLHQADERILNGL